MVGYWILNFFLIFPTCIPCQTKRKAEATPTRITQPYWCDNWIDTMFIFKKNFFCIHKQTTSRVLDVQVETRRQLSSQRKYTKWTAVSGTEIQPRMLRKFVSVSLISSWCAPMVMWRRRYNLDSVFITVIPWRSKTNVYSRFRTYLLEARRLLLAVRVKQKKNNVEKRSQLTTHASIRSHKNRKQNCGFPVLHWNKQLVQNKKLKLHSVTK